MCDATSEIFATSAAPCHCVKSVHFFGPCFSEFGLNMGNERWGKMRENTDQKKSEQKHFSRRVHLKVYYHQELTTLLHVLIKI